jgi:hypothetical protein
MQVKQLLITTFYGWIAASTALLHAQLLPPPQTSVLRFNGNQIARAPLASQLNLGSTFTMETWVFAESVQPYAVIMGKPYDPRSSDPFMNYVLEMSDDGKFEFVQTTGVAGTYRSIKAPTPIQLKKWTHVAGVLSGGTMRLFVNGVEVASGSSPGVPNAAASIPFAVGAGASPQGTIAASGIRGAIRQARVWSVALSATEIQSKASSTITGNEQGLIVCWPLDDGAGGTARSIGPTTLTLTLGTSSGALLPTWIRTDVLEQLDSFFQPTTFQLPSTLTGLQDLIPFDIDGDRDLDLVVTDLIWPPTVPGTQRPIVVMRNNGAGGFSSVTEPWVSAIKFVHPRHWTVADFTRGGNDDLVIVDHGTDVNPFPGDQNRFLRRSGTGALVEETSTRFPSANDFTHNVASGDVNGDGFPDIYVCNIYGGNQIGPRFLMNNGTGVFTADASRIPAIIANLQQVYMSSVLVDVDKDGDLDLILGGLDGDGLGANFAKDGLLLNNGSGQFAFATSDALPDRLNGAAGGTVAISSADFNNDGWPDLLMSTLYQYRIPMLQLLMNDRTGKFYDASARIPQSWPTAASFGNSWIRWTFPADFNNDGWMDFLAVGQNECPTKIFMNNGNGTFRDISDYVSFGMGVQACAVGDFDGDGRIDIVAAHLDRSAVFLRNVKNFPVTSVREEMGAIPGTFHLVAPYPNPFNPTTTIRFSVEKSGRALVSAFNVLGQEVRTLFDAEVQAGVAHHVVFDAAGLTSGVYFVRLESNGRVATQKVILVR